MEGYKTRTRLDSETVSQSKNTQRDFAIPGTDWRSYLFLAGREVGIGKNCKVLSTSLDRRIYFFPAVLVWKQILGKILIKAAQSKSGLSVRFTFRAQKGYCLRMFALINFDHFCASLLRAKFTRTSWIERALIS